MDALLYGTAGLLAGLALGSPTSRRIFQALWHRSASLNQETIKLVIVVRPDLGMTTGKVAAQSAHAAVISYQQALEQSPDLCKRWLNTGQRKVVVQCDKSGEQGLLNYVKLAKSKGIVTSTVIDAGRTQVMKGTLTVAGIGPAPAILVDQVTGKLRVY